MDRFPRRYLVVALALAFAGTGAFAHGTRQTSAADTSAAVTADTSSVKGTSSSDVNTAADAATTPNYSGNTGAKSTPGAADEDQNDEGGARGKGLAKHRKHKASAQPGDETSAAATKPDIQSQSSDASPPASGQAVSPSNPTMR